MNVNIHYLTKKIGKSYWSVIPCLPIPEDLRIFTYFCLPGNSFQMEFFGCENVKPILNSH